jgi:integrase
LGGTEDRQRQADHIPLPAALRDLLKARYAALNGNVVQLRAHEDQRTVFSAPKGGGPIDYQKWRMRRWVPLLKATAPDAEHPKREPVAGTPHMLRHAYATALIQSGANAKTVQTVMGHHSVAFTMDQYADAWPEALTNAGEAAAALLFANQVVAKR